MLLQSNTIHEILSLNGKWPCVMFSWKAHITYTCNLFQNSNDPERCWYLLVKNIRIWIHLQKCDGKVINIYSFKNQFAWNKYLFIAVPIIAKQKFIMKDWKGKAFIFYSAQGGPSHMYSFALVSNSAIKSPFFVSSVFLIILHMG